MTTAPAPSFELTPPCAGLPLARAWPRGASRRVQALDKAAVERQDDQLANEGRRQERRTDLDQCVVVDEGPEAKEPAGRIKAADRRFDEPPRAQPSAPCRENEEAAPERGPDQPEERPFDERGRADHRGKGIA